MDVIQWILYASGLLTVTAINMVLMSYFISKHKRQWQNSSRQIADVEAHLHKKTLLLQDYTPLIALAKNRAAFLYDLCISAQKYAANDDQRSDRDAKKMLEAKNGEEYSDDDSIVAFYHYQLEDRSFGNYLSLNEHTKWVIGFRNGLGAADALAIIQFLRKKLKPDNSVSIHIEQAESMLLVGLSYYEYVFEEKNSIDY
ncbi:MAG: hypothetical protein JXQ90_18070 [Cyclobacteriaceae bacterium]